MEDLLFVVKVFVSDLLDYDNAAQRLSIPVQDGVTPFMNAFYFSEDEAQYLGQITINNSKKTLTETLQEKIHEKAAKGATELCTSHDFGADILRMFSRRHETRIPQGEEFQKRKAKVY